MSHKISATFQSLHFRDSFVFVGSMLLSALLAVHFIGLKGAIASTSFAVLCTYSLYNAKPDKANLLYVILWMLIIIGSSFLGALFGLSWKLYLLLFVISYFYYYLFGKDPVFDRAVQFCIILVTIGSAMPKFVGDLAIGSLFGTTSALIVCHYLLHKNVDLRAFKDGIFTHELFKLNTHLIPRSLIYSLGMFLSLWLPHYFGIEKNYWATITFVMVMPPKASTVLQKTWFRFLGSVIAVALLFLILQIPDYFHFNMVYYMIGLLILFSFILPLCFGRQYTIVTFGVTCYSLILVELAMYWNHPMMGLLMDRVVETAIGGAIAIVVSLILRALRQS